MKRRIISHYEFVRKIGAGGSGVVFLATDTLLQRPVVLKLLKRGALTAEQVRTTQLREARLASAIDHPNVCAIYEVGEVPAESGDGAEAYIVMQYIPGQALDKLIAAGPANLQLVLSAGIQIADGLAAAHSLGIFHRDLKPANVMLTEGGLIKILDFGLARRLNLDETEFDPSGNSGTAGRRPVPPPGATYTARGGTIAYMAPEQFVTGQSSVQSDLFALGLILYELVTGRHPFHRPDAPEFQSIRAIQFADPTPPREINRNIPIELQSVILRCLEKQPSARFASAADLREALKTIMMAHQLDTVGPPGESVTLLPSQRPPAVETPEEEKRTTGILSMLAERFRESGPTATTAKQNTLVVLPFINFGTSSKQNESQPSPLYGYALADALAARLARMPSLIVRPSSSLATIPTHQLDPLAIGRKLLVHYVLAGNFLRSDQGFDLNWQLLDVNGQSVRTGGSISVASFDLVAVQTEISNEVFSTLQGIGGLTTSHHAAQPSSLSQDNSEDYLQARAVLSSFMSRTGSREDLDRARELFESVTTQDVDFAPGWSGLGITHLQYASHGLGGQMHVLEARRAFDKALQLDPGSVESNLYRVYMLLSRGEKESARHGIENLLQSAGNDWNVHLVAGQTLRIDGMYEEALEQFNTALRLNPSNAALIYNNRARVFQYQNQLELAADELEKGLTLEPKQPLLRISLGYQQMRTGDLAKAIETLEKVTSEEKSLRIVYPTIALCYVQLGDREKAATFIVDETLSAAEADSEMAYRLATYFALEGDESEALHWLRRAIYLGNENYPWFSINPAWRKLGGHGDFERILEDLKKSFRKNQKNWRRLLAQLRD
ncbi:serine/threonine-protein kinase [Granulicella tundricola]|uniref:Serine/threonine protein kinase n=1 Tax=Granulicella tundricola (strain ATCC BAA-1859 / DSM 23138 / MP5ACTX9) TaxID=1198114 RepID=E8WY50_GRATM|nr:serine/threonine-protein kinase [Granulicella tundricola]ADW68677.1 serine/threonine protein kinase [Granulicella tundricola MP5ACTX9]